MKKPAMLDEDFAIEDFFERLFLKVGFELLASLQGSRIKKFHYRGY